MTKPADKTSAFRKVGPCLYRYKDRTYYARFKSGGKEIRQSLRTTDRKLAERNLAEKKQQQSQIDPAKNKMTLAELCDTYSKTVQHQKPKTVERKTYIVKRIKDEWPGGSRVQVCKIKPTDINLWPARYKFGPVSRNLHLASVKEILSMAVGDGVIASSPAARLKKTKQFGERRHGGNSRQSFKASDYKSSTDMMPMKARTSLSFLGLAGLGQAEASTLEWPDVSFEREQITTFRHKTKSGFAIPLYPQVRPLLEKRYAQRASDGRVFRINDAKKAIAAACKRLKLPAFSHRSFRRMFIVRAIERGVDIKVIAQWQGHKDGGKLILETYSHVNPVHSKRMAQLMTTEESGTTLSQ